MAEQTDKITKHRLATSRITTVISISLVLFMIGLLGIIIINARTIANNVRENIKLEIMLSPDINEGELSEIQKELSLKPYVKLLKYNTKEENTQATIEVVGHDFREFAGNTIDASIHLKIKSEYTSIDSLSQIEKELHLMPHVKDVVLEKNFVEDINKNLHKIGIILLTISGILLIISMALINNTIRLSIYAKRFIIRSMLLVGAKKRTIYSPFVLIGIIQGLWGGIIAIVLLAAVLYGAYNRSFFSEIIDLTQYQWYGCLFAGIILIGILITWLSTLFSVRRYIKMKTDKLYF